MRIPLQIHSQGKNILGIVHLSNHQFETPIIIIMCYGLNGSRVEQHRMSVKLGDYCVQKGLNLARFDYSNVGMSEGDFIFSSLEERVNNIVDITEFLSGCFNGNVRIYLIAFSDGAKVALQAKNKISNFFGSVFWNPIINIPISSDDISPAINLEKNKLFYDKKNHIPYKPIFGAPLNTNILKELKTDTSVELINDEHPKLFIFGARDQYTVLIKKYLYDICDFKNSTFKEIKDSGHLFCNTEKEKQVIDTTIKWVLKVNNDVI